jgi:hypothetical protein
MTVRVGIVLSVSMPTATQGHRDYPPLHWFLYAAACAFALVYACVLVAANLFPGAGGWNPSPAGRGVQDHGGIESSWQRPPDVVNRRKSMRAGRSRQIQQWVNSNVELARTVHGPGYPLAAIQFGRIAVLRLDGIEAAFREEGEFPTRLISAIRLLRTPPVDMTEARHRGAVKGWA